MAQPGIHFDEHVAQRYDEGSPEMFDPAVLTPTVDFLAEQARGGPVLELGIGTGRVALPLSERGLAVQGIDESEPMVAQLRAKPGADAIPVTIGDFATTVVGERFALVYLVFNTITNLVTQEAQVACFRSAAAQLRPGGRFVIEVFIPVLRVLPPGTRHHVFHHAPGRLSFDEYDVVNQRLRSHHYTFGDDGRYEVSSPPFRYVWPAELDLMAQLAGLRLRERWAGWNREPLTSESESHVSVWERPLG